MVSNGIRTYNNCIISQKFQEILGGGSHQVWSLKLVEVVGLGLIVPINPPLENNIME